MGLKTRSAPEIEDIRPLKQQQKPSPPEIRSLQQQQRPSSPEHGPLQQEQQPSSSEITPVEQEQQPSSSEITPLPESTPLQQQHESSPKITPITPNLPCRDLLTGPKEDYLKIGVPLYEASIKCDWKAAKAILDKSEEELVRYSITENGETALHVAASAKVPQKKGEVFVRNLVAMMNEEGLALENENYNTALYLAAAAGNLETVRIMVEKNRDLVRIAGAQRQMFPLYAAVLFGNYNVVRYLFETSEDLSDADGWNDTNRGWLLEKCVENDMFDIALNIVEKYPNLGSGNVLAILARKPEALYETQSTMNSFFTFRGSKVKVPEIKSIALQLLRVIWKDIANFTLCGSKEKNESIAMQLLRIIWKDIEIRPKKEIEKILRGPPDLNIKQDKSAPGRGTLVMQLQDLISYHIKKVKDINKHQPHISKLKKLFLESVQSLDIATRRMVERGSEDQALEQYKRIAEHIYNTKYEIQRIDEMNVNEYEEDIQLEKLKRVISDHIGKMKTERGSSAKKTHSSRVLFIAAEMGNTNFLVDLIRHYPDLIWQVNDNNQTIFHIAVRYRHVGIYNLLYEIGAMKDLITPLRDPYGNNMLHLAGMSAIKQLEDVSGDAFRMQRELLWFEDVNKMIPPSYREQRNQDGLTPRELFTKKHRELVTEGEKWTKNIAAQCIVVAALIATMVFAAVFTVPGGYNQISGIPILYSKLTFQIFVVADAISLFCSTASILYMFLSVFTSRYGERDFLVKVPKRLITGLSYLFLSMTSMMVAFCTGFFLLYQKHLLWMPIAISVIALIPFFIYMKLQFSLFLEVILLTFGSRRLFDPKKRVLYYDNPKF